jgi:hypothetical protein
MRLIGIPGQEARLTPPNHKPRPCNTFTRDTHKSKSESFSNEYGVYICKRRTAKLFNLHTFTFANAGFLRSSHSGVTCRPSSRCVAPFLLHVAVLKGQILPVPLHERCLKWRSIFQSYSRTVLRLIGDHRHAGNDIALDIAGTLWISGSKLWT